MTTLTADRAASTFPVFKAIGQGALCVAWGTYTLAANPSQNDVIEFCKVPAGATVVGGWLMGADIDTGTEAFDMDIGWAANGDEVANTAGFGNLGVITGDVITDLKPVAGIYYPLQAVLFTAGPKKFNAETTITGLVNAAANAGGTGALTVVVLYHN